MDFIENLRNHLTSSTLPGADAHKLMMPKLSSGSGIRFKNTGDPKKGAVLIMLYERPEGFYFPLIQRPPYEGVHGGQVAFPGGKWEESDRDLNHTALREAHEEVGINMEKVEVIGSLSEFYVGASNHLILPVVGFYHGSPAFVPDNYEVEEVIEASVEVLLEKEYVKETEITTSMGHTLVSPYFDVQNRVVWGATAMMLSEFSQILKSL